jgi:stage IV sporulation protein FB
VFYEPTQTQFDLRWRMFGIDVRVSPFFWLAAVVLGFHDLRDGHFLIFLIWVACFFVSILVHELGHVFMGRYFGSYGHIVLYAFGGLAIGSNNLSRRWQRILVSLAGPGAQFVLLAAVVTVGFLTGLKPATLRIWESEVPGLLEEAFDKLIFINLMWPLLNLLPLWPLDGGQITRELFLAAMPRQRAIRASLILSIVTAVAGALFMLLGDRLFPGLLAWVVQTHSVLVLELVLIPLGIVTPWNAIFFGVFAVIAVLEMRRQSGGGGTTWTEPPRAPWVRDPDWWKSGRPWD